VSVGTQGVPLESIDGLRRVEHRAIAKKAEEAVAKRSRHL
jgi:hypothetical protein